MERREIKPKSETGPLRCKCGGSFYMGFDQNDDPYVIHTVPHCAEYEALESCDDAADFCRNNRLHFS